jgi:hypothetical protein
MKVKHNYNEIQYCYQMEVAFKKMIGCLFMYIYSYNGLPLKENVKSIFGVETNFEYSLDRKYNFKVLLNDGNQVIIEFCNHKYYIKIKEMYNTPPSPKEDFLRDDYEYESIHTYDYY